MEQHLFETFPDLIAEKIYEFTGHRKLHSLHKELLSMRWNKRLKSYHCGNNITLIRVKSGDIAYLMAEHLNTPEDAPRIFLMNTIELNNASYDNYGYGNTGSPPGCYNFGNHPVSRSINITKTGLAKYLIQNGLKPHGDKKYMIKMCMSF